ncbi:MULTISPECIES: hypothetical protein [Haloarcula]|uniref:hypothetical protein n=1 Tax=Haloarcula TaxID=2237 RepID=UPI0023EBB789|nr:hypothetical protein [Halomicroarcula sp. XH51]
MSFVDRRRVARETRHGTVSFLAGFLTGFGLFMAVGATPGDALFSAVAAATLVTVSRALPG